MRAENFGKQEKITWKCWVCTCPDTAAVLYSLFGYCKSAKADFKTWLIYFLEHIHGYDNNYSMDLAELLLDNLLSANKLKVSTQTETSGGKSWQFPLKSARNKETEKKYRFVIVLIGKKGINNRSLLFMTGKKEKVIPFPFLVQRKQKLPLWSCPIYTNQI